MYIYIYIYIYMYIYIYIYIHIFLRNPPIYTNPAITLTLHPTRFAHILWQNLSVLHKCMYAYIYIYIYIHIIHYTSVYLSLSLHMYIYIYIYNTHIHTHTCVHMYPYIICICVYTSSSEHVDLVCHVDGHANLVVKRKQTNNQHKHTQIAADNTTTSDKSRQPRHRRLAPWSCRRPTPSRSPCVYCYMCVYICV